MNGVIYYFKRENNKYGTCFKSSRNANLISDSWKRNSSTAGDQVPSTLLASSTPSHGQGTDDGNGHNGNDYIVYYVSDMLE